ncbi:MAG TPA: hypothetical protein VFX28_18100 [Methylomirabilota bacterium]|nr:hypothetical protein [Methylomirabilota bacterium]
MNLTEHQITFRDVPAGVVRCLRCQRLFTARELVAAPYCLAAPPG